MAALPEAPARCAGTTVGPPAPREVRTQRTEQGTTEHRSVALRTDRFSSGPAADPHARRLIAARRWNRRAQQAARRAARASAAVR